MTAPRPDGAEVRRTKNPCACCLVARSDHPTARCNRHVRMGRQEVLDWLSGETGHRVRFRQRSAGMTCIRPCRPLYHTSARCSCGWEWTANTKKREAMAEAIRHLRAVKP